MRKILSLATAATFALAACGGDDGASSSPAAKPKSSMSLSEAFCSDLHAGRSPMAIYGGVKSQYTPQSFADYAYGAAAISCPEQLKSNQALRTFLEAWNINPDA